jgi:hypothetical protein
MFSVFDDDPLKRSALKKFLLLPLLAAVLLLIPTTACSVFGPSSPPQPILTTYINDQYGYSVGHPKDWQMTEESKKEVYLLSLDPEKGYFSVGVLENATLPISEIAKRWLVAVSQMQDDVVLVDTVKMEGLWDWYLSYDYVTKWGEDFHAESFFKQIGTRVYRIETVGEKASFSNYPFSAIISSFKLSTEQPTK